MNIQQEKRKQEKKLKLLWVIEQNQSLLEMHQKDFNMYKSMELKVDYLTNEIEKREAIHERLINYYKTL